MNDSDGHGGHDGPIIFRPPGGDREPLAVAAAVEGGLLSADDSTALDALAEAGFVIDDVPVGLRARAERVAGVLGLLDTGLAPVGAAADSGALVDVTLARVQMRRMSELGEAGLMLSPNDDDALEALVGAGYEPERVAPVLRRRAAAQAGVLSLLEPSRAELRGNGRLVAATLERVQAAADGQSDRFKLELATVRARRFRLTDALTVAALLLIATAAIGPMVGAARSQARRAACFAGLGQAGPGFAAYAADFKDSLPMASASVAGQPWWFVGSPGRSNSANMYKTVSAGYAKVGGFACDGNAYACRQDLGPEASDWRRLEEVSYSYQNMFSEERPSWNSPNRFLVIVDASPVVRRAFNRQRINPLGNSMSHGGRGQNALFSDGAAEWLASPVLASGDNIWLPRVLERAIARRSQLVRAEPIKGDETPDGADDAFVGP